MKKSISEERNAGGSEARVFISYGRKDASELAARIQDGLAERGVNVWLDTSALRAGKSWEQQIVDGLRKTDVVVALLSPHSTRRGDAETGDSVCLDELALARFSQPPTPIVPVLAVKGASIPLTVFRLHYLDFVNSLESEDVFKRKFEELLTAVADALSGRTKYRSWDNWLRSGPEFTSFLYSKHQDFTGRDWLFAEIDDWRKNTSDHALLVTGEPGIGKSSIVAELAFGRLEGAAIVTYCCQWDVTETLRQATFVRSVAYQLASRMPAYADQIESSEIRRILENAELDPPSAFELGVLTPLSHLEDPPVAPALLCIDALDEAVSLKEGPSVVSLLESRIERFPWWLKLVATTRNDKKVMRLLGGLQAEEIKARGEKNFADLRTYVINRLNEPAARAMSGTAAAETEGFVESLLQQSEGSFLYAQHFLQGVSRGRIRVDELGNLPPGLNGTYDQYLRRAFPTADAFEQVRPVLEILCAADGPLPRALVGEASDLDERSLAKLLAPLTPFVRPKELEEKEPQLALWHKSFYDFLTDIENADSDFGIDETQGDRKLAAVFIERVKARLALGAAVESVPNYLLRRGLDHLARGGQFFDGLSSELVTELAYCSSWGIGGFAIGGLPAFAQSFVSSALSRDRFDAVGQLIEALSEVAERHYIDAGLVRVEKQSAGNKMRVFTPPATGGMPLHRALLATGLAISVADQVLAQRGNDSVTVAVVEKLGFMGYVAGGLSIAGWSSGLSGYFEDQGYALDTMITNLKEGVRAQTWKR